MRTRQPQSFTRRAIGQSFLGLASIVALRPAVALGSPVPPPSGPDAHVVFVDAAQGRTDRHDLSYNLRTQKTPRWRALCKTADGVGIALDWAEQAGLGFAIRSGGHCFEGFSQHDDLVIDLRGISGIRLGASDTQVAIGAGATVGTVNRALAARGLALPMGYCAGVGIAGHALGGGMGFLVRRYGLLSDRMTGADVITADGSVLRAAEGTHRDLFWALRGAGGGSFGIVSELSFAPVELADVLTFNVTWRLGVPRAKALAGAWSDAAMAAPDEISSTLYLKGYPDDQISIRLTGVSTGTSEALSQFLANLEVVAPDYSGASVRKETWGNAAEALARRTGAYPANIKYKSAMIATGAGPVAAATMIDAIRSHPPAYLSCSLQALGGRVDDLPAEATAFPHRAGTGFCLQAATNTGDSARVAERLTALAESMTALAPHTTGGAYVNYPDRDIDTFSEAYWGRNVARLAQIKARYDPGSRFRHAQSISL